MSSPRQSERADGAAPRGGSVASGLAEKASIATRAQGVATIAVIVLVPVYIFAGWLTSIPALAIVTLLTWVDGRINSWIGTRIARKQHEDADVKDVLDKIEGSDSV